MFFSAEIYNFTLGDNRDKILELNNTSILKASYRDVTFKFGRYLKKLIYKKIQDFSSGSEDFSKPIKTDMGYCRTIEPRMFQINGDVKEKVGSEVGRSV